MRKTIVKQAVVLVVEDDDRIRDSLCLALRQEGYEAKGLASAEGVEEILSADPPDLILLDVMLPGLSGLDLCHRIRQSSSLPIIMVTARDDSHDVVAGLEAGADDYVTKPYLFQELAARIRSLLRRTRGILESQETLTFGDLVIEADRGSVRSHGAPVDLTKTEFRLLCELAENPKRVLSRDQLLESVWGYDYYGDGRIVDAHIRRLRKKIGEEAGEPGHIVTVRGLGYRFEPEI